MIRRFSRSTEESIAALRAYWDARVLGDREAQENAGLESRWVESVERICAEDHAPLPTAEFKAQLFSQLMDAAAASDAAVESQPIPLPTTPASWTPAITPVRAEETRPQRARSRWLGRIVPVGPVLAMLLTLVAGISIWQSRTPEAHQIVPLQTEITADGVVIRTLLEEHVPGGALPGTPTHWIAMFKFSLEPGEHWRDDPIPCDMAAQYVVGLVESGTLAMINAGPFAIRRADGSTELVEAGKRGDVHPGDSWVYISDSAETNLNKWNPGSEPVVAYQTDWSLEGSCEGVPGNPEWIWHGSQSGISFDDSRPVVARLDQVVVEPGGKLSAEDARRIGLIAGDEDLLNVIGVESGALRIVVGPRDQLAEEIAPQQLVSDRTLDAGESWISQLAEPPQDGHVREFWNAGEDALILSAFRWSYSDGTSPDAAEEGKTRTPLVKLSIPGGTVPRGVPGQLVINRTTVPAGKSISYPESCGEPIMTVALIESGSYLILADGRLEITRASGAVEVPDSGVSVVVDGGDSFVHFNKGGEASGVAGNAHEAAATIVQAVWFADASCTYGHPEAAERADVEWLTTDRLPALPDSAGFEISIERVTLTPYEAHSRDDLLGFVLPANPEDNLALLVVESGQVQDMITMESVNSSEVVHSARHGPGEMLSLDNSLGLGSGMEREIFAAGTTPAEVLIISIRYHDASD
ncbi:MAG: hypothetical protein IT335_09300 [Thermomicrobiales bacterium]|jgi:hypothetical protein|nr:hypothetical protein [Thermomicrobiales bacterium]